LPEPDEIDEGTEDDVSVLERGDRLPRRGLTAVGAGSDPSRASPLAVMRPRGVEISSGLDVSGEGAEELASGTGAPAFRALLPRAPRAVLRDGDAVEEPAEDEPVVPDVSEPVDPDDPLVSAKANGITEMPEPTPRATARAPTRPTKRALLCGAASVAFTARLAYSIERTRPLDERR